MHMGVVLEVLPPGVEDGQEADLGPRCRGSAAVRNNKS